MATLFMRGLWFTHVAACLQPVFQIDKQVNKQQLLFCMVNLFIVRCPYLIWVALLKKIQIYTFLQEVKGKLSHTVFILLNASTLLNAPTRFFKPKSQIYSKSYNCCWKSESTVPFCFQRTCIHIKLPSHQLELNFLFRDLQVFINWRHYL